MAERKISICMLVSSDLDHDPRVQKEAMSAHKAGYYVTVICRSAHDGKYPYKVIPLEVQKGNMRMEKYIERALIILKMIFIANKLRPDLIHANDLDTLPSGYLISKLTGAMLLYDAHELWVHAGRDVGKIGGKLALWLERILVRRADAVVTVSKSISTYISSQYKIEAPLVVMNATSYVPSDQLNAGEWCKQFNRKRIVLFQGLYVEGRGIPEAVLAGKYLPLDVVMVFRGYGPLEKELRDLVKKESLADKVFFVPPVPMFELVSSAVGADFGISPSDPQLINNLFSAPNKIFEYMMAGVPCVAADTPDVREILMGMGVGRVFKPKDPKDLADVVTRLLNDGNEHKKMKERCLANAYCFSWDCESQKLLEVYKKMLTDLC